MRHEMLQALENLEYDRQAQEALAGVNDDDELREVLRRYGIELTGEDMVQLRAAGIEDGPLDEAALDQVSGGAWMPWWLRKLLGRSNPHGGGRPFGGGGNCGGR